MALTGAYESPQQTHTEHGIRAKKKGSHSMKRNPLMLEFPGAALGIQIGITTQKALGI